MTDDPSAWHSVRMRVKNALDQAAYQERKLLDQDSHPYTLQEREEADALQAEISQLVARADAFNRMVTDRLAKEAEENEEKAVQLKRFQSAMRIKVEFAAF